MLAQNFKTPAELGLTEAQHRALVLTLNALERGELTHVIVEKNQYGGFVTNPKFTGHFNMRRWNYESDCGTVCCIGGTAEILGGLAQYELDQLSNRNLQLSRLFYPNGNWDATPAKAAKTLRGYLTTGVTDWSHVG